MRTRDMLQAIQDIATLQSWMYANENNKIKVKNSCNAELELSMDEDGEVKASFLTPCPTAPLYYDDKLSIPIWLGIIEQLQTQPAERPDNFESRWEEIKFEYAGIKVLN